MFTDRTSSPRPGTFAPKRSMIPSSGWIRIASRFGSGSTRRLPEQPVRDLLELDRDLGRALRQPLARPEVERDARPAPVVDLETGGDVGLGLGLRVDLGLLAVARDRLAGDPARAVLAADDVGPDLVRASSRRSPG